MRLLSFWRCEKRLKEALVLITIDTSGFCLTLVSYGSWVTSEDNNEGGEREERKRIDGEDVQAESSKRAMDAVMVVDEDNKE